MRVLISLLLMLLAGTAAGSAHDRYEYTPGAEPPPLMPGTKMPFKLWETEQLADGVYAFRYSFYRTFFVVTDEGVIAADPLSPQAAQIMRDEIAKITEQPVKVLLYTHSHWDHAAGGQIFKDEGATVVAQRQCAENFAENPHPDIALPDVTYRRTHIVEMGGKSVESFYFGPSHDNCLAVMVINPANLLFLVDISNPPDGWAMFYNPALSEDRPWHMVPFFTRLQELVEERGIETVIGGHMAGHFDPVTNRPTIVKATTGPATVVKERLEFWTAITSAARDELAAGTPPDKVPDVIVEKGLLADKISGYDPEKMRILMRRMTSLALTGE